MGFLESGSGKQRVVPLGETRESKQPARRVKGTWRRSSTTLLFLNYWFERIGSLLIPTLITRIGVHVSLFLWIRFVALRACVCACLPACTCAYVHISMEICICFANANQANFLLCTCVIIVVKMSSVRFLLSFQEAGVVFCFSGPRCQGWSGLSR